MRLRRRELLRAGDDLGVGLGKPFVEARAGEAIEGRLVRRMDLASGRFALVEKSREFTLVPWKPGLERQHGKTIAGRVGSNAIDWHVARGRSRDRQSAGEGKRGSVRVVLGGRLNMQKKHTA